MEMTDKTRLNSRKFIDTTKRFNIFWEDLII